MYGPGQLLAYGTQHILTMYGGVIAPPLIVGGAAGLSPGDMALLVTAGLFLSGLATLLQTLGLGPFGSRLPIVQGISFAQRLDDGGHRQRGRCFVRCSARSSSPG